jgi:hypothetical protein
MYIVAVGSVKPWHFLLVVIWSPCQVTRVTQYCPPNFQTEVFFFWLALQLKDGVEERPEETAAQKQKEEAADMYDTFDMRVDRHWSEKKVNFFALSCQYLFGVIMRIALGKSASCSS